MRAPFRFTTPRTWINPADRRRQRTANGKVTSPRGSAAVLWFSPLNHAQLVTGLPNAPVIRPINAAFLRTPPSSIAISDDGNWLAVSTSAGLYLWGPVGQMNRRCR